MKPENQDFFDAVEQEYTRRMGYHADWQKLKEDGAKALRSAGYSAPALTSRKRFEVVWQDVKEINSSTTYADWISGGTEEGYSFDSEQKEVDNLSEDDGFFGPSHYPDSFNDTQTLLAKRLLRDLTTLLTPKQFEVYQLVVAQGLGVTQAARQLGATHQEVSSAMVSIQKRLRKAYRDNGGKL